LLQNCEESKQVIPLPLIAYESECRPTGAGTPREPKLLKQMWDISGFTLFNTASLGTPPTREFFKKIFKD